MTQRFQTAQVDARNSGASRVLAKAGAEWYSLAEFYVYRHFLLAGPLGDVFEQARAFAELCGVEEPHHPNAWGALTLSMVSQGLIERTGELRQSSLYSNHARSAAVWRLAHGPKIRAGSLLH